MPTYYGDKGCHVYVRDDNPTEKELGRMTICQLLILAKKKKGFKRALINFMKGENK